MYKLCVSFCLLTLVYSLNSPQKTHKLARENYKLVPYFAKSHVKKYNLRKHQKEEMIQYGYEGFMKACERYDETRGFKLSTYSRFWIQKYMDDYIKDKMKNDLYISLTDDKMKCISHVETKSILNEYDLYDWERELLTRKYLNRETFKSIAKSLNISRNTLHPRYEKIFEKIRSQNEKNQ